ncbi:MAG TPA: peptidoglycan DD-metalloendopeptidase family protein [Chloroflexia bacterium]|nr:peptidoglycan DD-metalloendopeptidase family protein [Chloroflexia bacterium]
MATSEYDRTLQILQELEEGDRNEGLFSCFALSPGGEVYYFDEVGSPYRAKIQGAAVVRGSLVNLGKMPLEVISLQEAYRHLSDKSRQNYREQYQAKLVLRQEKIVKHKRERTSMFAAAGLVILLAFGALVLLNNGDVSQSLQQSEARLKIFYAGQGVDIRGYQDVPLVAEPGSYNPLGPVSISRTTFRAFLTELNSPALPEADSMYQVCVDQGCDPAVALAFFEHESTGGRMGVASYTKSIGNIRCTDGYDCFTTEGNGSFRRYNSWTDGLRDWAKLLQYYKNEWKLVTLEEIIPRYAPQSDNNNEAAYIAGVKKRVDDLRKRDAVLSTNQENELPTGNPVYEMDSVVTQGFNDKHPEIDIARPREVAEGTQIHATISGVITVVRGDPLFGNRVFISNNYYSAHYNHLTENIPVQSGQVVKKGDVIGLMGSTGKSTGPHLDYELFQGQQRLNPADWIYRKQ